MRIVGGFGKSIKLRSPGGRMVRPTSDKVREALFNILGNRVDSKLFVDGFAGSGAVGIEAISRGVKKCFFIEKNRWCVNIIKHNLQKTKAANNAEVLHTDIFKGLRKVVETGPVDFIFLDPPYNSSLVVPVCQAILERELLKKEGILILEHDSKKKIEMERWEPIDWRKYGNTALSFWKQELT